MAIRKVIDRSRRNFVKCEVNPGDIPTRMSSNLTECFSGCWFGGPSMLLSHDFESPEQVISTNCTNDNSLLGRVDVHAGCLKKKLRKFNRLLCIINVAKLTVRFLHRNKELLFSFSMTPL